MSTDPVSLAWRGLLRFSLRGLIVVVVVIGGSLGWIVRNARVQQEAVAALRKAGAGVYYDWEWTSGKHVAGGKPWVPTRIVEVVGVDYFGHVSHVYYGRAALFQTIEELQRKLEDEALNSKVDLNEQPDFVIGCRPMDELPVVKPSRPLLPLLKELTKLSSLDLNFTDLGGERLEDFEELSSLRELDLSFTRFTDAGLVHLRGLKNLSRLNLSQTRVTDAGLVQLKGLACLSQLDLSETQVTEIGIKELLQALPNLKIIR